MKSLEPSAVRDVLLLSCMAGSADATGYLGLGRVFTSNMTGNVVLLGIDLGQGHLAAASRSLFVLFVFMLGVAFGGRLGQRVPEKDWRLLASKLIGVETGVLFCFGLGWSLALHGNWDVDYPLLALLALAMGLQSAALNRLSAPGVGTTAITSTVTALVNGLVAVAVAHGGESSAARIRFQAGVIMLYGAGAAASGFVIVNSPRLAGWLPVVGVSLVWALKLKSKSQIV